MLTKELSTAERVQPRFIEPMQVALVRELPDGGLWTYEAKLDGYRCLAAKRGGRVVLWSRRGNGFTDRFPEIARACENLPPDTIGRRRGYRNRTRRTSFVQRPAAQPDERTPSVLCLRRAHLPGTERDALLPLEIRRDLLVDVLADVEYPLLRSTAFDAKPAEMIRAARELELEGVIAKRKGSIYEPGRRSHAWLEYRSQEFVIGGYTVGNPFDALIVGCYEAGELRYVSRVKGGFTPPQRRELYVVLKILETGRCPFANLPEARRYRWDVGLTKADMGKCRWLRPLLVAQIEFAEWTPDGHLRHSSFAGLRDDKDAQLIVRE